jgi:hypothetical protein
MWTFSSFWLVVRSLTEHPPLLVAILGIQALLLGLGKSIGLPLLFWHEDRFKQCLAGVATACLLSETLFAAFLLLRDGGVEQLEAFWRAGALPWLALIVLQLVIRYRSIGAPRRGGQTPDLAHYGGETVAMESVRVRGWPLLAGAVGTLVLVGLFLSAARSVEKTADEFAIDLASRHVPMLSNLPSPSLHALALFVFVGIGVAYLALGRVARLRPLATPAVGICMLVALFAAAYGAISFYLEGPGAVGAVLFGALLLLLGAGEAYRIRVPALEKWYRRLRRYPEPGSPAVDTSSDVPGMLPLLEESAESSGPRPLVLVCTSGGGVRAATWTAAILGRLDEKAPDFRRSTKLVTGASGGMVGASFWIAAARWTEFGLDLPAQQDGSGQEVVEPWRKLTRLTACDGLTATTHALAFRDLPNLFAPWPNLHDRGRALEEAWLEATRSQGGAVLDVTMDDLADGEAAGRWPSLVFSPMIVEDGRRLIISNRDLGALLGNEMRWIGSKGGPPSRGSSSTTGYQYEQLFPGQLAKLPVRTAARLSASFPYVAPATVLPTKPRRRVVDAGYYDNYGLSLACDWLLYAAVNHREWLEKHVSRVLVVQIRDNVSQLSLNPEVDPRPVTKVPDGPPGSKLGERVARALEGLTTPLQGLFSARQSVMAFRNDGQLESVIRFFDRSFPGKNFVSTTIFELRGEVSLSWYLTEREIQLIEKQATSKGIGDKIDDVSAWLAPNEATLGR